MRRALAGVGVVAVLATGCATISQTDEAACDVLYGNRDAARDDVAEERARIIAEFGDDEARAALSAKLRPYVEQVVSDARREERGREVRYFAAHLGDALSICMDLGW